MLVRFSSHLTTDFLQVSVELTEPEGERVGQHHDRQLVEHQDEVLLDEEEGEEQDLDGRDGGGHRHHVVVGQQGEADGRQQRVTAVVHHAQGSRQPGDH